MAEAVCYEPRGASLAVIESRYPAILLEGPRNTGKTRAVMEKVNACAWKYPGARFLFVRKFRSAMNESVLPTWEDKVLGRGSPVLAGGYKRAHRETYNYPNGSTVVIGGADRSDKYRSAEYDIVVVFEATEIDSNDSDLLLGTLRFKRLPYQQIIYDTNPAAPGHWLNVRADVICDEPEDSRFGKPWIQRLKARHTDNPSITVEELNVLRSLTGVRRARYYEGKWVGAEGLVYEMFVPGTHEREGRGVRSIVCVDDGTRNPFAAIRLEQDGDGNLYVTAERYQTGLLEAAKVAAVRELATGSEAIIVDPAAAGLRLALQSADGLPPVYAANNDVLMGIGMVQQRFGDRRLFISPSCVKLIGELQTYEWADNAKKDVPVKEWDHALDALRYGVVKYDGEADWGTLLAAQANPAERARPEQPRIGEAAPAIVPAFVWPESDSETWSM